MDFDLDIFQVLISQLGTLEPETMGFPNPGTKV